MEKTAPFLVYNASAGSGKTYTLVRRYLSLCLKNQSPLAFRQILAITFTNKVANEMKERILEELQNFGASPDEDSLLGNLAKELGISLEQMQPRADDLLTAILHNYSAFSVSTIDKFTNRIIRSFARNLNLAAHYEVEMDGAEMLREAIDEMLAGLTENSAATQVLLDFVSQSLDENRSPRPEKSLLEMGQNLFQERAFSAVKKLKEIGLEGVENARRELHSEKVKMEKNVQIRAEKLLTFLDENGFHQEDFYSGYLYKYLMFLFEGRTDKWIPSATLLKTAETGEKLYSQSKKHLVQKFAPFEVEIVDRFGSLVQWILPLSARYFLVEKILRKIHSLAALTEIDRHLQHLKERSNRLPIGEFNRLVSERLEDEPVGFVFEKLGEKYAHFFVDEFQDTSILQWQNLTPLINNSIAGGGSAMIVGDGKQSIYRWRGGEVEQFLELSNDEHPSNQIIVNGNPVSLYNRQTEILENNWRSRENIVQFNNEFFVETAAFLKDENHQNLYQNTTEQNAQKKDGGLVEISLLSYETDKEEHNQLQCEKCLEIVQQSHENGFAYGDITFLTRNNRDGALLSEYFLNRKIPVVTPDSLSLGNSPEVQAVVSFLAMLARPDAFENRYPFFIRLWQLPEIQNRFSERHSFLNENIKLPLPAVFAFLKDTQQDISLDAISQESLSDQAYSMARFLKLNVQSNPFIYAFFDAIQKFEMRDGQSASGFLRWWEEKGKDEKIKLGETENAVQVMSIHKSKGLQFPVTVVPFANWRVTQEPRPEAWLDLEAADFHGLPAALVGLSKPNENAANERYATAFQEYEKNVLLDNLNLLYVAFTRAQQELHVISTSGHREDGKRVQGFLKPFLKRKNAGEFLRIGEPVQNPKAEESANPPPENSLKKYASQGWRGKLQISQTAPKNWNEKVESPRDFGLKIHSLMAEIETENDIEIALEKMVSRGDFSSRESGRLKEMALEITRHPRLFRLFQKEARILNENEILIPHQKSARPDRVVILENQTHILDYKTGTPNEKDERQILEYRQLLTEMNFPEGDNCLVYLGNSINVKFAF